MKKNKPIVAIIGAGKIAYSLAAALNSAGYNLNAVISKNIKSARKLADKFGIKNYSDKTAHLSSKCNLFFICVPDDQIKSVAKLLALEKLDFKNSLFVHLSGCKTSLELRELSKKKAAVASFHIMQTFPSKKVIRLAGLYASIESKNSKANKILLQLAGALKIIPIQLQTERKIYWHLAGVFAANFFVSNLLASEFMLKKAGLPERRLIEILKPIVATALNNSVKFQPSNSISGPLERGDVKTVRAHLSSLKKLNGKKLLVHSNYVRQSLLLLDFIKEKNGRLTENQAKIKDILMKQTKI